MTKFQKELFGFLIGLLVVILIGGIIYKVKSFQDSKYWNSIRKKQTTAVVTGYTKSGPKSGNSAIASYIVNGKEYSVEIEDSYVLGEKFQLEFNENNPSENKIYREFPVFEKNEKTNYIIGRLTSYNSWFFRYYNFWIDNEFYEGGHYQEENSKNKYSNVEEGQLFVVEYWTETPKRSIIHLDKPVEYISQWWKYKW